LTYRKFSAITNIMREKIRRKKMGKKIGIIIFLVIILKVYSFSDEISLIPSYSKINSTAGDYYKGTIGANLEYDWQWGKYWSTAFILNNYFSFKLKSKIGDEKWGTPLPNPAPNGTVGLPDPLVYSWGETDTNGDRVTVNNLAVNLRVATIRTGKVRFFFDFGPGIAKIKTPETKMTYNYAVFTPTSTYWDGSKYIFYGVWDQTNHVGSSGGSNGSYFSATIGSGLLFGISENLWLGFNIRQLIVFSTPSSLGILNASAQLVYKFGNKITYKRENQKNKRSTIDNYEDNNKKKDTNKDKSTPKKTKSDDILLW
jgi:hypothetical protein